MSRVATTIACAVALAACAGPLLPQATPAGPQFDGTYIGTDQLVSGVTFQCGDASVPLQLEIRGGQANYPFFVNPPRTAPLPVQVGADSSLFGQMQYGMQEESPFFPRYINDWVTLTGRIDGMTLEAGVRNMRCRRRLLLQRS